MSASQQPPISILSIFEHHQVLQVRARLVRALYDLKNAVGLAIQTGDLQIGAQTPAAIVEQHGPLLR